MKRKTDARSPQQVQENSNKLARITDISDSNSEVDCLPSHSNKMAAMMDLELEPITEHEIYDQLGEHGDDKSHAICNVILQYQNDQNNKLLSKLKDHSTELIGKAVKIATDTMESKYNTLLTKYKTLEDRVINMELQSRRSNLIISGINEAVGFTDEVLRKWFSEFCAHTLKLEGEILVERIHRLGAPPKNVENQPSGRPRPPRLIIVKFTQYQQKMMVWSARQKLKDTKIFLDDDYPEEIRRIRRHLLPIAKEARVSHDMKATVRVDRLLINGNSYTKDQLHLLPECLHAVANSSTWTNEVVGFFRSECPLSNHNPSPFVLGNDTYSCIEEHLLSQEALLFDDTETAKKIRSTEDPVQMLRYRKDMMRNNPNYNKEMFEKEAPAILIEGLRAKFAQNEHCRKFLMKTGKRHIVEASPYDRFFGIGYGHRDKNFILNRDKWGNNALGKGLMTLREEINM